MNVELDDDIRPQGMSDTQWFAELHPELQERIFRTPMGLGVSHSLVLDDVAWMHSPASLNRRLAMMQEMAAGKLMAGDWTGFIFRHEKPYRFEAYQKIADRMTDAEYWQNLSEVWIDSNNIYQNRKGWAKLLASTRPERQCFMNEAERAFFANLPEKFVIYRGSQGKGKRIGQSWTLSRDKAEWFADSVYGVYAKGSGVVRQMTVNKQDAIGYLNRREEQEIVLVRAR